MQKQTTRSGATSPIKTFCLLTHVLLHLYTRLAPVVFSFASPSPVPEGPLGGFVSAELVVGGVWATPVPQVSVVDHGWELLPARPQQHEDSVL